MSLTGADETAKVASTDDILKASGNDETKFELLIELVQGGKVTNKDVVDTCLLMVRFV